jgi:cytokinin dehydrogenase
MKDMIAPRFDLATRSWVREARRGRSIPVPPLDGELLVDEASLSHAAEDFGHLIHHRPIAVLAPRSEQDVVQIMRFARESGIKIVPRGQAFSGSGLSLAEGGIVVKMGALRVRPVFGDHQVEVSAGNTWREVLLSTLERDQRPPVMAQTLYLSVGGTLSVSGIDGSSFRYGTLVDNVLELRVVTGEGRVETCSPIQLPELFEAVLAGLGQCGIIISAVLPLVTAQTHVRTFELIYGDLQTMLEDEGRLLTDGRFDAVLGIATPSVSGKWQFRVRAEHNFTPPKFPEDEAILRGLNHMRGFERRATLPYFECVAHAPGRGLGHWYRGRARMPHPFLGVLMPDSAILEFAQGLLAGVGPSPAEPDPVVEFYRVDTSQCSHPLFKAPSGSAAFLVVFLSSYSQPAAASDLLGRGRQIFERARSLGGSWIPSSAVPLSRQEWKAHFGSSWQQFASAKRRFDPDDILSPGPNIF